MNRHMALVATDERFTTASSHDDHPSWFLTSSFPFEVFERMNVVDRYPVM
jgi:hypothetical protein